MLNGWLDPTALGSFSRESTNEIRTSLSIQDPPTSLPGAADPTPEDLVPYAEEYRLTNGDFLEINIYELRARGTEDREQVQIDELGLISLPVIGRIHAANLTVSEFEREIADILSQKELLRDAQVRVNPLTKRAASYTVFGFFGGIQTGSRFGPGTSIIPAPEFRLLEALATAGGLAEQVEEVWIYRQTKSDPPKSASQPATMPSTPARLDNSRHLSQNSRFNKQPALASSVRAASYAAQPGGETRAMDAEPPASQPGDTRELIEAVTGARAQPIQTETTSAPGEPATTPAAPEMGVEPPRKTHFMFLNGKWIEVKDQDGTTTAPAPMPAIPGARPSGEEPAAEPTVDWSAVAGVEDYRIIRIPAEALQKLDPRYNIVIRPGDVIRLKAEVAGIYYLAGQVGRPGAFSINAQKITLKAAIAASGGLAPLAWPDRCTIYRRYGDREEMIQVNLDRIFSGRDPDLYVKPDDIINVGSHPSAVFLATARNAFRMFYGFGFVYDRNFGDIDSFGGKINPASFNALGARFPGLFQNR